MGQHKRRLGRDHRTNKRVLDRFRNTCAITPHAAKTAALVFEKVVGSFEGTNDGPRDILTYNQDGRIHTFPAMAGGSPNEDERQVSVRVREEGFLLSAPTRKSLLHVLNNDPNKLCEKVRSTGHRPVLCYPGIDEESELFKAGDAAFIVSCLSNLSVVDEEKLNWEQVVEFRKDLEARAVRTRFLFWLNEEMDGDSKAKIQDHLADLHEQHDRVLRKFSIVAGAMGETLFAVGEKNKWWSAASLGAIFGTAGAGLPLWTSLAAGIPVAREVLVSVRRVRAQLKKEHDAIAFIEKAAALTEGEE